MGTKFIKILTFLPILILWKDFLKGRNSNRVFLVFLHRTPYTVHRTQLIMQPDSSWKMSRMKPTSVCFILPCMSGVILRDLILRISSGFQRSRRKN